MNKIEWLEFYASGVIMGFMCLFGITANTLTLFVLNGFSEMRRQSINVYLTVLAIYDNGVLINAFLMLSLPNIIRGMERLSDAYQYETLDPMSFHHHESISSSSFFPDEFSPILSSGSSKNDVGGSATSGLIDKIVGHHQLFDDNGNTIKSDELMLSMQGYSLSESEAQDPMNDDDKFNRTILELGETAYNSLIINISSPLTTYSLSSFSSSSSSSPSTFPSSSSAPSSSPSILSDNSGDSVSVYNDEQDMMDSRPHSMMADRVQTYYVEIVYPLALISQTGSIWTTCLITAERYFAVCHPIKIRTFANRARAVWAVTILSLFAILYNIPRFFEVEVVNYNGTLTVQQTTLRSDRIYFNFYYIFCYLTLLYIIPLSVLSMLNVKIYQAVRKANRNRASLTNQEESELNIASMLVLLVSIFLACNAPAFFVNCLELIDPRSDFYIAATNLSNLLVCFNSSVNFFIYCIFGKKFRHKLRQVLCCRKVQHAHRCASRTVLPSNSTHIVDGTCV